MNIKEIVAKVVEQVKTYLENGLETILKPAVELEVKKRIEAESDKYVDVVLEKAKALIPGTFDDVVIEGQKPKLKADVKAFLLAEADKISDKV